MNLALRRHLIQAAKIKDRFVHYDDVATMLGLADRRLDHCAELSEALDDISTYEAEHGRPLLSVLVVHKEDFRPGAGFFKMAKRVRVQRVGQDNDAFFIAEERRIREYWLTRDPNEPQCR